MDSYFYEDGNVIKIEFDYKEEHYTIHGRTRVRGNKIHIDFSYYGDEVACIMLEYNFVREEFYLGKLQAKKLGSSSAKDRGFCMKPALKEKGALDLLVMFSIKLSEIINPNSKVYLYDLATVNDNKPLSLLKFFSKGETTYSKYGFIRKKETLKFKDDSKSYEGFLRYMKDLETYFKIFKLEELEEDTLKNLRKIINSENRQRRKENLEPISFSKNYTLEKFIKILTKTQYWDEGIILINKDHNNILDINLNTDWYLSKYYYKHNISSKEKVKNVKISKI
jgi:hypothetical protein